MKFQFKYYFIILLIIPLYSTFGTESTVSKNLITAGRNTKEHEIHELRFVGNYSFDALTLNSFLITMQSNRGIAHNVIYYYYKNFKQNSSVPKKMLTEFRKALKSYSGEISYFKQSATDIDSASLWNFYNTNGFHNVGIYYTFLPDSIKKKNILTFYINENSRYSIDTIVFNGFNNLPYNILQDISGIKRIKKGEYFSENKILKISYEIQNYLQNNGYYFSKFEIQPVLKDTINKIDSVTVTFDCGKRQKIAFIDFIDSTKNQSSIAGEMKMKQLDFSIGEWFKRKSLKSTENNFNSLGLFDLVVIDTSSKFHPFTDTSLNIVVELRYKKQIEWAIALFGNQTQIDKLVNVGIEGNVMHKNVFGAAQSLNLFTNAQIKDFSRFVSGAAPDYEYQAGLRLNQPLLWSIENMKVGASASLLYSYYKLNNYFNLSTTSLPIKIPIKLTNETYINQIVIDFTFERQSPSNLSEAINNYRTANDATLDSVVFLQNLTLLVNLDRYLNQPETHFLTSNLMGITLMGDSRNHPFSPTGGDYFLFTIDGWNIFLAHPLISGISRFFRAQTAYSLFSGINDNLTNAFKVKIGTTYLFQNQNSYIPFERQFFVGGANSVRGWSSRQLHYSVIEEGTKYTNTDINFLSSFIGSGTVIEGSYELRYKFSKPSGWERMLAEQIERIGLVAFVDFGNSFNWFAESEKNKSLNKFTDYFTKLAWAAGFGFRYDTPFGPIRVDLGLPIYRPFYSSRDYFIFNEENVLKDYQLHLGIGQAF